MDLEDNIGKIIAVWNKENNVQKPNVSVQPERIVNQIANFFSPGEYYYYIFNFTNHQMEFVHPNVQKVTGILPKDFSLENMLGLYHPEDLVRMQEKERAASQFLFSEIGADLLPKYKVVYMLRYQLKDGTTKKILHQAKTINVSKDGKIQQVLGVHADVSYLNTPIDHKISFIGDEGYPSYYAQNPSKMIFEQIQEDQLYTKQELKIISLIAEGNTNEQIAKVLFITVNTVKTHRKNILNKSKANNFTHLIATCIREGLI